MKLETYTGSLDFGSIGHLFSTYSNGYISGLVAETADFAISIYPDDLIEFAADNPEWADEAIVSGLTPDPGDCGNYKEYCAAVGAAAWYLANEHELYRHLDDCLRLSVCTELKMLGYDEIDEDQASVIDWISASDFDKIEEAVEWVLSEFANLEEASAA